MSEEMVLVDYTNYRGERRVRRLGPLTIYFGSTQWHPERQWLLRAVDEEGMTKDFAMSSIHSWRKAE